MDESIVARHVCEPGAYVLAAVVADPLTSDPVRDKLRDLVLRGKDRLHWRDEQPRRRDRIAQTIADGDFVAIVTIGTPMRNSMQERIRSLCLEHLLLELQELGISQVWLESRSESSNRNDLRAVRDLVGHRMLDREVRVSFRRPLDEPMLWLPDAVAGTVTAAHRGEARWLQMLGPMVTLIEVKVR